MEERGGVFFEEGLDVLMVLEPLGFVDPAVHPGGLPDKVVVNVELVTVEVRVALQALEDEKGGAAQPGSELDQFAAADASVVLALLLRDHARYGALGQLDIRPGCPGFLDTDLKPLGNRLLPRIQTSDLVVHLERQLRQPLTDGIQTGRIIAPQQQSFQ